jgi:serine/threonine-protein kinase
MDGKQLIGQYLGRYKIVSLIGRGGMGAVFKGDDPDLQRSVAIKVMRPRSDPDRFLQEARAAARLKHQGIVEVFDIGQEPLLYIVMEFIPGQNLERMLRTLRDNDQWMW